eukprot:15343889-Ditylum_brightwellii.AAC.1
MFDVLNRRSVNSYEKIPPTYGADELIGVDFRLKTVRFTGQPLMSGVEGSGNKFVLHSLRGKHT